MVPSYEFMEPKGGSIKDTALTVTYSSLARHSDGRSNSARTDDTAVAVAIIADARRNCVCFPTAPAQIPDLSGDRLRLKEDGGVKAFASQE